MISRTDSIRSSERSWLWRLKPVSNKEFFFFRWRACETLPAARPAVYALAAVARHRLGGGLRVRLGAQPRPGSTRHMGGRPNRRARLSLRFGHERGLEHRQPDRGPRDRPEEQAGTAVGD